MAVFKRCHLARGLNEERMGAGAQGSGIGSAVLTQIFKEADAAAFPSADPVARRIRITWCWPSTEISRAAMLDQAN
jgi:hypothetical protein